MTYICSIKLKQNIMSRKTKPLLLTLDNEVIAVIVNYKESNLYDKVALALSEQLDEEVTVTSIEERKQRPIRLVVKATKEYDGEIDFVDAELNETWIY